MDITTYTVGGLSTIAVITGLVKVARAAGLPSKYAPALSVTLGAIIGISAAVFSDSAVYLGGMGGIAAGLFASGIYDLGKTTAA
ncbi:MAG: hypothetical protein VB084_06465 [Syntrophomonadaceae bacterium]|nr:hypothetical protein [Syntrophomonadaceae bacterium]